ncbi:hypothetical protein VTN49DRAFT_3615 [Thermomyces lanuginosus]|uniref:uncharacterized protein n=1 Tax=Thermomyces lanuginosus TaxID=5541 RepID=UPI003743B12A
MAQAIPQHVSNLLSHLISRPGVQSTLILSRKDGSIIQVTGKLASSSPQSRTNNIASSSRRESVPSQSDTTSAVASSSSQDGNTTPAAAGAATPASTPYKPTYAEVLAAQIHAFVSNAATLSSTLAHPSGGEDGYNGHPANGLDEDKADVNGGTDDADGEGREKEDDDEVKLLRLRTKKNEIVIVPSRKYLLCVVHDVTSNSTTGGGGSRLG